MGDYGLPSIKRPYRPPELRVYGDIRQATQSGPSKVPKIDKGNSKS